MNQSEVAMRYWQAFRYSIEEYVAAVERNENGLLIHCLAKVVRLRESELDRIEHNSQKGA